MGNRATVIFGNIPAIGQGGTRHYSPGVYLHWQGGPESVYAFLAEMDRRRIREADPINESARFCQLVGEYFDADEIGTYSLGLYNTNGIDPEKPESFAACCPGDNGVYLVYRRQDKPAVVRRYVSGKHDEATGEWDMKELGKAETTRERNQAPKVDGMPGYTAILEAFEKIDAGRLPEKDKDAA